MVGNRSPASRRCFRVRRPISPPIASMPAGCSPRAMHRSRRSTSANVVERAQNGPEHLQHGAGWCLHGASVLSCWRAWNRVAYPKIGGDRPDDAPQLGAEPVNVGHKRAPPFRARLSVDDGWRGEAARNWGTASPSVRPPFAGCCGAYSVGAESALRCSARALRAEHQRPVHDIVKRFPTAHNRELAMKLSRSCGYDFGVAGTKGDLVDKELVVR